MSGLRSLFTGISGLKVHELRLDVISNNIANVNTTGFKASRVRFDDVLSQTIEIATGPAAGRGGQNPKQIGLGVLGATISRDMSQGSVEITNKTTDLAIQGGGMFVLRDGENIGQWYTRDGGFAVDAAGSLTLGSNGFRVQGWNGVIDPRTREMTINSSNPVEDVKVNLAQQQAPVATSSVTMGGNLDARMGTAIDPVRVSWTKNGTTRELEMRFTHVDPTRELYRYQFFDPKTIDPATGDFTRIVNDASGLEAQGIVELDANGRVIANYLMTADDDAADPATFFLSTSEKANLSPTGSALWSLNNPTRTFNGFDFITLDTDNNGNPTQFERNSRIAAQTTATNAITATKRDVTITVPNIPLSISPVVGGDYPNGFTNDAVYIAGTGAGGNPAIPGDGLGVPVEYAQAVTNEVIGKISSDRTSLQLAHSNILDTTRANPNRSGNMSAINGTDTDSLKLMINGTQFTRISNATVFTAGATQFKLDPDNGVITLGSALANGINAIASYDYEVRPSNTRAIPTGSTATAEFGARAILGGTVNATIWTGTTFRTPDLSGFYVSGSGSLVVAGETFTEVPSGAVINDASRNVFSINPANGALILSPLSTGVAVAAGATLSGSYATYRRFGGEQTTAIAVGSTVDAAEVLFAAITRPYIPNSVGTITLNHLSGTPGIPETFTEVPFGSALASRQFSVDPGPGATQGDLSFGTFFNGDPVVEAGPDTFSVAANFKFYNKEIGVTDGAGPTGAGNTRGGNDLWRVATIPNGGADLGRMLLWLQGDGFAAASDINEPTATSLLYLPTISTATNLRAEINYNSDDRVNVIIPNGLTKTPNVNPLVDKTTEAFTFAPNISQITGNAGANNRANSGDSVSVAFKNPETFKSATAIEVFDSLGKSWNVPIKFEKLSTNQWLMYGIDPTDSAGTRIAFQRIMAFRADGTFDTTSTIPYASPAAAGTTNSTFTGFYFDPPQAGGAPPPINGASPVMITPLFTNLSQTARSADPVVTSQNGFPPGKLETFSFNNEGFLVGLFDNGRSLNLGRIALQGFVNPAGLVAVGGNLFKDTVNAGKFGSPQRPGFDGVGTIVPGALEGSNVDLSVEFVDLIITQRGFQAQSRTISTADQVLQEVLGLKR